MNYAGVIIENQEGKILFQLRDNKRDIPNPNLWSIFGGGINDSEKPKEAAVREILEELKIKVNKSELRTVLIVPTFKKVNYIYRWRADKRLKKAKLIEGQKMKFFTITELLKKENVVPSLRPFLKFYSILKFIR